MHQQVVLVVLGNAHLLHDTGGHGERGNTSGAHHGVDFGAAEDIENLSEHHAGDGIEDKGHQAQGHNHDGLHGDELVGAHGEGNGDAQQQRDEVGQVVLGRFGQAVEHAALTDEVAEHQEAHQRDRGGSHQAGHEGDHDGEQNAGGLGHSIGAVLHLDGPLLLGGHQLDGRGLDDGHQGHVGISGYRDGPNVVGAQHLADQNGGGAVGGADDADGGGVLNLKAQQGCQDDGEENAELRRSAEEEHLRVGKQRPKVNHRANANKQQQRERLGGLDAHLEQPLDDAMGFPGTLHHLVEHAGAGQVHQDSAEAHGQQQRGLVLFFDGEPNEHCAHHIHDYLLPGDGQQAFPQEFHCFVHPSFFENNSLPQRGRYEKRPMQKAQVLPFQAKPGRGPAQDVDLAAWRHAGYSPISLDSVP